MDINRGSDSRSPAWHPTPWRCLALGASVVLSIVVASVVALVPAPLVPDLPGPPPLDVDIPSFQESQPVVPPHSSTNDEGTAPKIPPTNPNVLSIEQIDSRMEVVNYGAYTIRESNDFEEFVSKLEIYHKGRLVATLSDGRASHLCDATTFGLANLLDNGRKQLVVSQSTGGAHCCDIYRIYDLGPNLRLIFDGRDWPIGDGWDELAFEDLDKDGDLEFVQKSIWYDYAFDLPYTGSPQPPIVFAYDTAHSRYLPANRRFEKRILSDLDEVKDRIETFEQTGEIAGLMEFSDELFVFLGYIYAGREKQAWRFLERNGPVNGKFRAQLRGLLDGDPVYVYLYHRK